jgi:HD-GYP domain-containing protein (c-di-GMP phosphodiesterase class II)
VYLGRLAGLAPGRIALIEIAALLHDLGKLGVPDEMLEKPGKLTAAETAVMHRHSFDTFRILRGIGGLEEVALWAGSHHETLLGDGYPFHSQDDALPIEARVIMVADIFQALAQDRPYRASLPPERIMAILDEMAETGRIDRDLVALAGRDAGACWQVATQPAA